MKKSLPNNLETLFYYDVVGNPAQIASPGNNLLMTYNLQNQLEQEQPYCTDSNSSIIIPHIVPTTAQTYIGPDNYRYDGKDILINACRVTIDGNHTFNSIHIINGGSITSSPSVNPASLATLDMKILGDLTIDATSSI